MLTDELQKARLSLKSYEDNNLKPVFDDVAYSNISIWKSVFQKHYSLYKELCVLENTYEVNNLYDRYIKQNRNKDFLEICADICFAFLVRYQPEPYGYNASQIFEHYKNYDIQPYGSSLNEVEKRIDFLSDLRKTCFKLWVDKFKDEDNGCFIFCLKEENEAHATYFPESATVIRATAKELDINI